MKPFLFIALLIAAALAYHHATTPEPHTAIAMPAIADHVETHYYAIHGTSASALRDAMSRKGPVFNGRRFDAVTRWHVYWQFRHRMQGERCIMSDVQTRTEITMTLPRWENRADAKASLQQQWDTYYAALLKHEQGHADFATRAATEVKPALLGLTASDCDTLSHQANETGMRIVQSHAAQEKDYDRTTNHGMNEGALFP